MYQRKSHRLEIDSINMIVNDTKSFTRAKFKDLSNQIFYECDFSHCDLRGADLTGSVFAKSNLSHCRLFNAKISLNCKTFENVKLDNMTVKMFLYLITLSDIPDKTKNGIIDLIGHDNFIRLKLFFDATE